MQVFSPEWFEHHQSRLLWLLQAPLLGRVMRRMLAIRPHDVGWDRPIVELLPHAYTVANPDGTFTTDFRTHEKYGKRLYYQLLPLWTMLHAWDMVVANPLVPALNVGFDTLTSYPDPDPEISTCDGTAIRDIGGESWASLVGGSGSFSDSASGAADAFVQFYGGPTSNTYRALYRSFFLFNTASLTAAASISDATLSLYGVGSADGLVCSPDIDIYAASPASDTTIAGGDFANVGATSYTGSPIPYSSWGGVGYHAFAFNATGRAAVNKTGISKFSARNANYDVAAVAPAWVSNGQVILSGAFADQTGSANDPKLEVTFYVSQGLQPKNNLRPRVFAPGRAR